MRRRTLLGLAAGMIAAPLHRLRAGDPAPVRRLEGYRWLVTDARFHADASRLLTISDAGLTQSWDAATGRLRWTREDTPPAYAMILDEPSKRLVTLRPARTIIIADDFRASFHVEGLTIHVWNVAGGDELAQWPKDVPIAAGPPAAADEPTFTFVYYPYLVVTWSLVDGREVRRLDVATLEEKPSTTEKFAIDRRGRRIASLNRVIGEPTRDGVKSGVPPKPWPSICSIRALEIPTKKLRVIEAGHKTLESIAISAEGERIASGSFDHDIKLWAFEGGALIHQFRPNTEDRPTFLAFHPKGRFLLSATDEGMVLVWDTEKKRLHQTIQGPKSKVRAVGYPDGKRALRFLSGGSKYIGNVPVGGDRAPIEPLEVWDAEIAEGL